MQTVDKEIHSGGNVILGSAVARGAGETAATTAAAVRGGVGGTASSGAGTHTPPIHCHHATELLGKIVVIVCKDHKAVEPGMSFEL